MLQPHPQKLDLPNPPPTEPPKRRLGEEPYILDLYSLKDPSTFSESTAGPSWHLHNSVEHITVPLSMWIPRGFVFGSNMVKRVERLRF